jgi:hypothetical protein
MIQVYDDIVPQSTQDFFDDLIHCRDSKINKYGLFPVYYNNFLTGKENENENDFEPGFVHTFLSPTYHSLNHFGGLLTPLFLLSSSLNFNIDQIILGRVFIQTPSNNPKPLTIHNDLKSPHYVCLYYVNDSDGDTIFFDDNSNEIKRVPPKKGRITLFDGSISHCGSSPSKNTRTAINICFNMF